jgi:sporulation protein YlmC with PRC-barrel domain
MKSEIHKQRNSFTVASLLGSKIVEADGTLLGHVADIQLTDDPPTLS